MSAAAEDGTFVSDPRVVAAAKAIATTDSGRRHAKTHSTLASAADYHEAIVVMKAVDEIMFSPESIARAEQAHKDLISAWGRGEANCDVPDVVRAIVATLKGTP